MTRETSSRRQCSELTDSELSIVESFIQTKVERTQAGTPTLRDNALVRAINHAKSRRQATTVAAADDVAAHELISEFMHTLEAPRFASVRNRRLRSMSCGRYSLYSSHLAWSQGWLTCLTWRNMPLFKTCFDFAIYPMLLTEVRPKTIFEIGAGTGASAIWLADMLEISAIEGHVYSVDLKEPVYRDQRVEFLQGDCETIQDCLTEEMLTAAPSPWMVVEDANVNTVGILDYMRAFLHAGDYMIFEDSAVKTDVLNVIAESYNDEFRVDTKFTDFYGRNVTSCQDSILRRC
jgi:cephalosporin hydroxylase